MVTFTDLFKHLLIPNAAYWEALWIIPVILLANLCLGIYHSLSVWYKITDKTHFGAYISIIGAVVTIALNYLLIPILSYKGSALATLAAYGAMMLISFFVGQKNYPIPYPLKKIGLYFFFSTVASFLTFYVFDKNIWIGCLFLILFVAIVYITEGKKWKCRKKQS